MLVTWGKKIPRLPTMNRNNNGYCMVLSGIDDVCVCKKSLQKHIEYGPNCPRQNYKWAGHFQWSPFADPAIVEWVP